MRIRLNIEITPGGVQLTSEKGGLLKSDRNLTVFGIPRGTGTWIGGLDEAPEPKGEYTEVPSFDTRDFAVKTSTSAFLFYTEWGIAAAHPDSLPVTELADQVEVHVVFSGYESIPLDRRREFEYRIQQGALIDRLTINKREVSWPRATRQLARWVAIALMVTGWAIALATAFQAYRLMFGPGSAIAVTAVGSTPDLKTTMFAVGGLVAMWVLLFVVVSAAVFATWLIVSRFMFPTSLRAAMTRWMSWPGIPMSIRERTGPLNEEL